ncbi:WPE palindromic element domain-containing protein [Wolbachia endosymbiont of Drosophila tsacasi]|nr:WPE palindromic element domain-containing protein [Wolbachia endosymbiont of Drosophila tsacasi]MDE5062212.1 WPE palindromic element domain-containing protein [Wolbachia endosymbiont of Drosophila tsacasi]
MSYQYLFFLSSQLLYDVIPVPRHWDPGNLTLNK